MWQRAFLETIAIFVLTLSIFSCNKVDVPKETPACIKKKVREEQKACLSKVYEYTYKGGIVFLFEPELCNRIRDEGLNDKKSAIYLR